jgi:N-acetylmuramoyl-L-alanine amidase
MGDEMTAGACLLALSVVFPREGDTLPAVQASYVIGAVEPGTTNVVVAGQRVRVHASGAWASRVRVSPGTNTLTVSAVVRGVRRDCRRVFTVGARTVAGRKLYTKLPYAADTPRPHPSAHARPTIVLDPGHGGPVDLGARSPHGRCEKDANLLLAADVRQALEARGYPVVLTRDDDRAVALHDRPKEAHRLSAAAFVSLHHNAPGIEGDAGAIRYACVYAWNPLGLALAEAVTRRLEAAQKGTLVIKRPRQANFVVTRSPEIPSCLVEADFITHPDGEAAIWDPVCRRRTAEAIAAGIADWHRR